MQGEAAQGKRHVIGPARSRVREGHRGGNVSVDVGREELVVPGPVGAPHDPGGRRSREQLQEHHPEGVHLRALSHHAPTRVERAGVTDSARCVLDPVRLGVREARKAKVGHLRRAVAIQQDVGALDVPVEDLRRRMVEVRQAAGCVEGGTDARAPEEGHVVDAAPLQALEDVASAQQLVHEEALGLVPGKAHEDHEVRVPELAQDSNLLLEAALLRDIQHLDGDVCTIALNASEDAAKGAMPQPQGGVEVPGGLLQLRVGVL
mmetsp:Transcript_49819/g.156837  ORF Transcript_49819/g.156837 Transcript_49819/m.156837 type:complete len:262 (+) Transcript_49819:1573-2358(+)